MFSKTKTPARPETTAAPQPAEQPTEAELNTIQAEVNATLSKAVINKLEPRCRLPFGCRLGHARHVVMSRGGRVMRMGLGRRVFVDFGGGDQRLDFEMLNYRQHRAGDEPGDEADDKNPR